MIETQSCESQPLTNVQQYSINVGTNYTTNNVLHRSVTCVSYHVVGVVCLFFTTFRTFSAILHQVPERMFEMIQKNRKNKHTTPTM